MSRPVIVVGDRTSHGGVVITGSPFSDVGGKAIARIGDKVTCPQKGHGSVTTIISGDVTDIIDGSPLARHGDLTACGATLISSQILTYTDVGGDSGGNSGAAVVSSPSAQRLASTPAQTAPEAFNDIYQLVDEKSGEPLANCEYAVHRADGNVTYGITDSSGFTQRIGDTDTAELLHFDLGDWKA